MSHRQAASRHRKTRLRLLWASAISASMLSASVVGATVAPAAGPTLDVRVIEDDGSRVWVVARVDPAPLRTLAPDAITVRSNGKFYATTAEPVLSARSAVGLVVDTSPGGAPFLQAGGRAGEAGFLLQLPAEAPSAVIVDNTPPTVVSRSSVGVADDLRAISALTPGGDRATSAALGVALRELRSASGRPVLVLATGARDAGGESAADLGERLRRAGAVLAVVGSGSPSAYWTAAAEATGGLTTSIAGKARMIDAFDDVADGLRSSYLVNFARSQAGGTARLSIDTGAGTASTDVSLPPPAGSAPSPSLVATPTPTLTSTPTPQPAAAPDRRTNIIWLVAGAVLIALLVTGVVIGLRLRRRTKAWEAARAMRRLAAARDAGRTTGLNAPRSATNEPAPSSAPPAYRAPAWPESPLFEPRADRDARNGRDAR